MRHIYRRDMTCCGRAFRTRGPATERVWQGRNYRLHRPAMRGDPKGQRGHLPLWEKEYLAGSKDVAGVGARTVFSRGGEFEITPLQGFGQRRLRDVYTADNRRDIEDAVESRSPLTDAACQLGNAVECKEFHPQENSLSAASCIDTFYPRDAYSAVYTATWLAGWVAGVSVTRRYWSTLFTKRYRQIQRNEYRKINNK